MLISGFEFEFLWFVNGFGFVRCGGFGSVVYLRCGFYLLLGLLPACDCFVTRFALVCSWLFSCVFDVGLRLIVWVPAILLGAYDLLWVLDTAFWLLGCVIVVTGGVGVGGFGVSGGLLVSSVVCACLLIC